MSTTWRHHLLNQFDKEEKAEPRRRYHLLNPIG
jgi:hypothetical protein